MFINRDKCRDLHGLYYNLLAVCIIRNGNMFINRDKCRLINAFVRNKRTSGNN